MNIKRLVQRTNVKQVSFWYDRHAIQSPIIGRNARETCGNPRFSVVAAVFHGNNFFVGGGVIYPVVQRQPARRRVRPDKTVYDRIDGVGYQHRKDEGCDVTFDGSFHDLFSTK